MALGWYASRRKLAYELGVVRGEWHEGVIVFPSGDLVVRWAPALGLCLPFSQPVLLISFGVV